MAVRTTIPLFHFRQLTSLFRTPLAYLKNRAAKEQSPVLEKPKKPLTGFFAFKDEKWSGIMKSNPDASVAELSKIAGRMWGDLSDAEKLKYKRNFESKWDKYKENLLKYEEMKASQELKDIKSGANVHKKIINKQRRLMGKPMKPVGAFMIFLSDFRQTVDKSLPCTQIIQMAKKKWNELKDNDKQKYLIQGKEEIEKYNKDMDEWEEQMIKQGYAPLVRVKTLRMSKKNQDLTKVDL